jgi:hypothetical protein
VQFVSSVNQRFNNESWNSDNTYLCFLGTTSVQKFDEIFFIGRSIATVNKKVFVFLSCSKVYF